MKNFDAVRKSIRPANMRRVIGLCCHRKANIFSDVRWASFNTSAALCMFGLLSDPTDAALSGGGMDAPDDLPTGSVKAFFDTLPSGSKIVVGYCQRTTTRPGSPK